MLYDLSKPIDRERFKRRCNALFQKNRIIELTERTKRSNQQNRYLHLLIGYLSIEVGVTLEYCKQEYFKHSSNHDTFVRKLADPLTGELKEILRSSAELSVEEMTLTIERFRNWSTQVAGIYLPSANEDLFLLEIEREMQQHKEYL